MYSLGCGFEPCHQLQRTDISVFLSAPGHALLSIDGDAYGEDGSNPSVVRVCSETKPLYLGVAQMVVRLLWEQDVGGSSPLTQTNFIEEGCHVSVSRYSGSFDVPTLNKCKPHRDFGCGFYLAHKLFRCLADGSQKLSGGICPNISAHRLGWTFRSEFVKGLRIGFGSWFLQGSAPLQMSIW